MASSTLCYVLRDFEKAFDKATHQRLVDWLSKGLHNQLNIYEYL